MRCGRLCLSCNKNYIAAATTATDKFPILGSLFATSVVCNDRDATTTRSNTTLYYHGSIVHENTSAKQALSTLHENPQNVLIYQGKFGQGAALLAALQRRIRRRQQQQLPKKATTTVKEQWLAYRQHQHVQAGLLNRFLMHVVVPQQPILMENSSTSSKAPPPPPHVADVLNQAALSSSSSTSEAYLVPWREIQGRIAAAEWQRKGVWMDALQDYIYPHFGVYPPSRQEYLRLLPTLPLLDKDDDSSSSSHSRPGVLMDIGTGTGALTAILLKRQNPWSAIATDISPLAVTCATENLTRLGLAARVQCVQANLFPPGNTGDNTTTVQKADVILCNPPWIPVTTTATTSNDHHAWIDRAIYDDGDSTMLRGFLRQAASHLRNDHGQVWLIMSDLAEHLQLRSRQQLLDWIHDGNLEIVETRQATPGRIGNRKGNKSNNRDDMEAKFFPLVAQARRAETIYLFRLRKQRRIL